MWTEFRTTWDRLVLPYWWGVLLLSARGTAGSCIWCMCLAEEPMVHSYHLWDCDWNWTSKSESHLQVKNVKTLNCTSTKCFKWNFKMIKIELLISRYFRAFLLDWTYSNGDIISNIFTYWFYFLYESHTWDLKACSSAWSSAIFSSHLTSWVCASCLLTNSSSNWKDKNITNSSHKHTINLMKLHIYMNRIGQTFTYGTIISCNQH